MYVHMYVVRSMYVGTKYVPGMYVCLYGWMDEWVDGWRMDGWMDVAGTCFVPHFLILFSFARCSFVSGHSDFKIPTLLLCPYDARDYEIDGVR